HGPRELSPHGAAASLGRRRRSPARLHPRILRAHFHRSPRCDPRSIAERGCAQMKRGAFFFLIAALYIAAPGVARADERVVAAYDGFAGFQGPIWATRELGLFKKHGLNGDLVLITGAARGMAALVSSSIDFAMGSGTASLPIRLRGGDVVILGAALNKFP